MYRVVKKLKSVKDNIRIWNKSSFGNIFEAKGKVQDDLKKIQVQI